MNSSSKEFKDILNKLTSIQNYNAIDPSTNTEEVEVLLMHFLKLGGYGTFMFGKDVEKFPKLKKLFKCYNEFHDSLKHFKGNYTLIHFLMSNDFYDDIFREIIS